MTTWSPADDLEAEEDGIDSIKRLDVLVACDSGDRRGERGGLMSDTFARMERKGWKKRVGLLVLA